MGDRGGLGGQGQHPGAGWLIRPSREDADSWIDERMISRALAHLGISPLDRFFKEGGELSIHVPARVEGDGTYAQIRLPMGVTRRWSRPSEEVGGEPGAGCVGDLAHRGRRGRDPRSVDRGQGPARWQRRAVAAAARGQCGCVSRGADRENPAGADHPRAVLRTELAGRGPPRAGQDLPGADPGPGSRAGPHGGVVGVRDRPEHRLRALQPRLSRYAVGMGPEVAAATVQALADLFAEMERRGKLLATLPGSPPATSRALANKPALGLHPLICVISECHELFGHPTYGTQAAKLAISVIKQGRKFGITLILDTQSPTAASIPTDVTRHVSCGVAFSVADHDANDGLLGSGKYRAGIRATELRMNTDRGTCVAVGVSDATFELLNTFHVPYADGIDMITPVVTRAMAAINELHRTGQPTTDQDHHEAGEIDHLTNIDQALRGERRVRTQVVLSRLAELDPATYEGWSFHDLTTTLARHGIKPVKSRGVKSVRAADITHALTHRDRESRKVTTGKGSEVGTRPGTRGVLPTPIPAPTSPT